MGGKFPPANSPDEEPTLTDPAKTRCLLCDAEIPVTEQTCPYCGTPVPNPTLSGLLSRGSPSGESPGTKTDASTPQATIPQIVSNCPLCLTPLTEDMRKCPKCGVPLRHPKLVKEEMKECPMCGIFSLASVDTCPKCGARFVKEIALVPPPELPPQAEPVATPEPEPEPAGPEPELTPPEPEPRVPEPVQEAILPEPAPEPIPVPIEHEKIAPPLGKIPSPPLQSPGRGLTNGLGATNGTSFAPSASKGPVSGAGLVNGTGMTNGTGLPGPREPRSRNAGRSASWKWKFLVILIAIVILIPTFIFLSFPRTEGLAIDGKFGDWSKAEMFGMRAPAASPRINVEEWSVQNYGGALYLYISTAGSLMTTSSVDSFYLFVDSDNDPATGYSVSGLGADYMLVLDGWDGQVRAADIMEYDSTTDELDWNSWAAAGSMTYSVGSSELEAMADLPIDLGNNARYLLLSQTASPDQGYAVSYPVPEKGGLLVVRLEQGSSVDPNLGTVPAQAGTVLAKLFLSCEGSGGTVTDIRPAILGAAQITSLGGTSLAKGEEKSFDIRVDTSLVTATDVVSVHLSEGSFTSTFSSVAIVQDSVHAYVTSAPGSIEIDGAFGDWLARLTTDTDNETVTNPNIDMIATGFAGSTASASFYVSVRGQMFQGVYAPSAKTKPSGGGDGGTVIPTRRSGEDILRIFIDSDLSNATGLPVTRAGKTIGADFLVDIRGSNGDVVSKSLTSYDGSKWLSVPGEVLTGKDAQRLELSVPVASIGGSAAIRTIIETTDWKDRWDWAWASGVPDPWVVDSSGNAYQSDTGALWTLVGAPALAPGDHIVDLILNMDGTEIYLLTNTGRTFYINIASPTGWAAGITTPINTTQYSQAVSFTFYSTRAGYMLTANGTYFWCQDLGSFRRSWTPYANKIELGVTDFSDIVYTKVGNTVYALRSAANSRLDLSTNGGSSFTAQTSLTGSTSLQVDLIVIGAASNSSDRLFVLCQDGVIRYSSNGGATWGNLGNLPISTGGNTTKYVGMGIDSTGYMWVTTDTGYCFRSTDTTTYSIFNYTGKSPISGLVAIAPLPSVPGIPEFECILVPAVGLVILAFSRRFRGKGKTA